MKLKIPKLRTCTQRAFTIIELLLVLTLVVVLAGVALPNFGEGLARQQGLARIETLARTLALARSTAVSTGSWVTVCPSANGLSCNNAWEQGILVFADRDGNRQYNDNDTIVLYRNSDSAAGSMRLRAFPNNQSLQYTPEGFTRGQSGNFTWCPSGGDARQIRQLIFTRSGRLRVARDSDADGYREGADGKPLVCD